MMRYTTHDEIKMNILFKFLGFVLSMKILFINILKFIIKHYTMALTMGNAGSHKGINKNAL